MVMRRNPAPPLAGMRQSKNTTGGDAHRRIPRGMIIGIALLGVIGVFALYSAGTASWNPWAGPHLLRFGVGTIVMLAVALVPIGIYRKLALPGWALAVAALIAVEFVGTGSGSQRWLSFAGMTVQPSELAKLGVIAAIAALFSETTAETSGYLRSYILPVFAIIIPAGIVIAQPDLGTAMMILGTAAAMLFIAGIPRWMMFGAIAVVALAAPLGWSQLYDYQKNRILVFLNPGADALGAGYQIIQSKIALGSGGFFGKGYLEGSQSRLNYLPEKQTDFVFTMVGEEFGFLGCLVILGLYATVIFSILRTGLGLSATFSRLLVLGIAAMMFFYVFVNIGMVTGLLPVVGAPLPMVSYGGTAMMTVFIAMGLVISAVRGDEGTD